MASSPSEDTTINSVLHENGLYLASAHWFQLLQDEGTDMSADEKNLCYEQPKKRWTRKVAHVDKFYPKLYNLASEVYDRLQKHSQIFPNLGKNKTSAIHSIGKLIANRRTLSHGPTSTAFRWGMKVKGFNLRAIPNTLIEMSFTFSPKGRYYYSAIRNIAIPRWT